MNKNEIFAEKLEEFIINEVEEKVEKLKGLDVLEATLKLTSKNLYEYINTNIGDAKHFTLLVKINGNYEIEVLYYYKGKLVQATTMEGNTGMIDVYTLLRICILQDSNTPSVEFTIYKCGLHKIETLDPSELSALNESLNCNHPCCADCKYYNEKEVNLLKNN